MTFAEMWAPAASFAGMHALTVKLEDDRCFFDID
jgi:hypothetical protein